MMTDHATRPRLGVVPVRSLRLIIFVLAFACGASVANIYYAQPLLDLIGRSFGVSQSAVTVVVTVTQVGYAVGLAVLLPVGDLVENRRLAARALAGTAVALGLAAVAPGLWVFLIASALIGVTSVVAQILVPVAAHLAPGESRGRYVGQVMSGLLIGIMLARTASSFAAAAWGWRSIYGISAVLMVVTAIALVRVLPVRRPDHEGGYGSLLRSSLVLARTEPLLLRRALSQALMFGAFTAYWTAVPFVLIGRHHLSQSGIAVFALIGAAGAVAAAMAGRIGDAGHGTAGRIAAIGIGLVATLLAAFGSGNLVLLGLAGVLLDFAVQGNQVLSLRDIYAIRPDARARFNSVYMTTSFLGGAVASAITGVVLSVWGWTGVALVAAAMTVVAGGVWTFDRLVPAAPRRPEPALVRRSAG
jgi:predicted MFS family arabinose efflux permease